MRGGLMRWTIHHMGVREGASAQEPTPVFDAVLQSTLISLDDYPPEPSDGSANPEADAG
jgi:hypothetical protein